jgi:hypothetical protein
MGVLRTVCDLNASSRGSAVGETVPETVQAVRLVVLVAVPELLLRVDSVVVGVVARGYVQGCGGSEFD